MKTTFVLRILLSAVYAFTSEGTVIPNVIATATSSQALTFTATNETFHALKHFRIIEQPPHEEETTERRYLRGKKHLPVKIQHNDDNVEEKITHKKDLKRELTNADELFRKPIGQWDIEDFILLFIILFAVSTFLRCLRRIHCCGCDILDCIGCYFCYELFFDGSPGLDYGLC